MKRSWKKNWMAQPNYGRIDTISANLTYTLHIIHQNKSRSSAKKAPHNELGAHDNKKKDSGTQIRHRVKWMKTNSPINLSAETKSGKAMFCIIACCGWRYRCRSPLRVPVTRWNHFSRNEWMNGRISLSVWHRINSHNFDVQTVHVICRQNDFLDDKSRDSTKKRQHQQHQRKNNQTKVA